jgi:hypothetical protein
MKGFYSEAFNLERHSKSRLARDGRQRNRREAADQLGRIQSDDVSAAPQERGFLARDTVDGYAADQMGMPGVVGLIPGWA